jgi:hypothetical protein
MTAIPTIDQLEQQFAASEASDDVPLQIASLNALASAPPHGLPLDQSGMGYSLRTPGYVNRRLGDYALGLTQLLKAQDILESLQLFDGLADVYTAR